MLRTRVLVVDDSVVARRLIADAIATDEQFEVVASAANGKIALQKIAQLAPDIVTLDIEMPEMDGLETLAAIRKTNPALPVIMFSSVTERAAAATLKALALGAKDYITKPRASDAAASIAHIQKELIPKLRCFSPRVRSASPIGEPPGDRTPRFAVGPALPIDVVAIGASTGGPNALQTLVSGLRRDLAVPVVITQHMPPLFTRLLAERLRADSGLLVREAAGGEALVPGEVWVAPGDYHLTLRRDGARIVTALNQGAQENSCRPAVDVMFRSVVDVYGGRVLAVVLTGMGQDGLRGSELVHDVGGQVLVQDEASSIVWGMPGFVAKAGLADAVMPIDDLGPEILRRIARTPRTPPRPYAQVGEPRETRR